MATLSLRDITQGLIGKGDAAMLPSHGEGAAKSVGAVETPSVAMPKLPLPMESHHPRGDPISAAAPAPKAAPPASSTPSTVADPSGMKICKASTDKAKVKGCGQRKAASAFYAGRSVCKECINSNRRVDREAVASLAECKPKELIVPSVMPEEVQTDDELKDQAEAIKDAPTLKSPAMMISELLPMLKRFRTTEPYWSDVGRAFSYVSHNDEKGLALWIQFGEVHGVDTTQCATLYKTFRGNDTITVNTVGYYAEQDSPELYQHWWNTWLIDALRNVVEQGHGDSMSTLFQRTFWLRLMFDGRRWWHFDAHHLNQDTSGCHNVQLHIMGGLVPIMEQFMYPLIADNDIVIQTTDKASFASKQAVKANKTMKSLLLQIHDTGGRMKMIKGAEALFLVRDFERKCDANPNTTGWINGVLECTSVGVSCRWGKPEDYITVHSSTWIDSTYTWEDPTIIELMGELAKVFPNKKTLAYFLKDCSSMLLGGNHEKLLRVWSGGTDAGKSMIIKLMQECFTKGKSCIDFPAKLLSGGGKSSTGPNPETAQIKGARVGFIAEHDAAMDAAEVKRWTGNDTFFARKCNENGGTVTNLVKLILVCNKVAEIDREDAACRGRFRITPCLSTFVNDPPADPKEQIIQRRFKKDINYEVRLPGYASPFLWILMAYFTIYKAEGLVPPPEVVDATALYWEESDDYKAFIAERIIYAYLADGTTVNGEAKVTAADLYEGFRVWWKNRTPAVHPPNVKVFREQMQREGRLGKQHRYKWSGIKLKVDPTLFMAKA